MSKQRRFKDPKLVIEALARPFPKDIRFRMTAEDGEEIEAVVSGMFKRMKLNDYIDRTRELQEVSEDDADDATSLQQMRTFLQEVWTGFEGATDEDDQEQLRDELLEIPSVIQNAFLAYNSEMVGRELEVKN